MKKRVLVVDDEPDISFSLKEGLEKSGLFDVETFTDPQLALGMKIILYTIFYYTHTKVNISSFSQTFFVSFHFRSLGNDTQKNTWAFLNIMNI
jgi:hypothetical protein